MIGSLCNLKELTIFLLLKILYTTTVYTIIYPSTSIFFLFFFLYILLLCHFPVDPIIWRGCTSFTSQLRRVETVNMDHFNKNLSYLSWREKKKRKKKRSAILLRRCWFVFFFSFSDVLTWQFICLSVKKWKTINKTKKHSNSNNSIFNK